MHDYSIVGCRTPIVMAEKKNDSIATINSYLPDIYHKVFDITEFIGQQLATVRDVRSNHYFPVGFNDFWRSSFRSNKFDENNLRTGSFDFMRSDIEYKVAANLPFYYDEDAFNILLDLCPSDENRNAFINENLEMFGLDIYMGQCDRCGNIFYEFHPNREIHLSPVFDYEVSLSNFDIANFEYASDFFQFCSIDHYQKMMIKYPQFRDILTSYLDVSLVEQIRSMARNRNFLISTIDFDSYKRYDEVIHKKLEKILK